MAQADVAKKSVVIEVDAVFADYTRLAALRLGYLFPSLMFTTTTNGITVEGSEITDESALRRNVLHAVYREKIYAETLAMRATFINAVTRK